MKFVIATEELDFLISKCTNVVAQRPPQPILSNIHIQASGNQITLMATDLTVSAKTRTEAKVLKEGVLTVPARRFSQLIKELTSVNVEIAVGDDYVMEVKADSSTFRIHGQEASNYPDMPEVKDAVSLTVPQDRLIDAFSKTSFAVAKEDSRHTLTGLYIEVKDSVMTFIGTDGKRLARSFIRLDCDPSFQTSIILPLKAVDEAMKILEKEGMASFYFMQDKVAIEANQSILITKLISGLYPDVTQVIPDTSDFKVALHKDELITLLRQVALFNNDETKVVQLSFTDGELRLRASSMDIGEGKVSMPVNYRGVPFEIAFNTHFFQDVLRHSSDESVEIGLTDKFSPALIRDFTLSGKENESGSEFVLMPMRFES